MMKRHDKIIYSLFLILTTLFTACNTGKQSEVMGIADNKQVKKMPVPDFEVCNIHESSANSGFLENRNFLMTWDILGPIPQGKDGLHQENIENEAYLTGRYNAPPGARWYHFIAKNKNDGLPGIVDFSARIPFASPGVFYACITLNCKREMKNLTLAAGSCGQMKIWINGNVVYAYEKKMKRAAKPDTDQVEGITLQKGCNRIVVKYMDQKTGFQGNRKFCLRFINFSGKPTVVH